MFPRTRERRVLEEQSAQSFSFLCTWMHLPTSSSVFILARIRNENHTCHHPASPLVSCINFSLSWRVGSLTASGLNLDASMVRSLCRDILSSVQSVLKVNAMVDEKQTGQVSELALTGTWLLYSIAAMTCLLHQTTHAARLSDPSQIFGSQRPRFHLDGNFAVSMKLDDNNH